MSLTRFKSASREKVANVLLKYGYLPAAGEVNELFESLTNFLLEEIEGLCPDKADEDKALSPEMAFGHNHCRQEFLTRLGEWKRGYESK